MHSLAALNALDRDGFVAALGGVVEHSAWVAARAYGKRPFASVEALHAAMMNCVREAADAEQLALLRAHPELAGREAGAGTLTVDSSSEQGRLGFTSLSRSELERMRELNRRYREKFGFPCIMALRLHQERARVMAEMERRLANDTATELANALAQKGA